MFISKSGLSRMLAVVMVSATLMSAVPAQAGAKDVAKKVGKVTSTISKVTGILTLAAGAVAGAGCGLVLLVDKDSETKDKLLGGACVLAANLCCLGIGSIVESFSNSDKKTTDKEEVNTQATVAAAK
ncbi:MAG: hypothetical protein NT124_02935 [Candidatus Dependentiae bacterium]|nr:hypothetical protein [Candidatus Dependentiae bacterium]